MTDILQRGRTSTRCKAESSASLLLVGSGSGRAKGSSICEVGLSCGVGLIGQVGPENQRIFLCRGLKLLFRTCEVRIPVLVRPSRVEISGQPHIPDIKIALNDVLKRAWRVVTQAQAQAEDDINKIVADWCDQVFTLEGGCITVDVQAAVQGIARAYTSVLTQVQAEVSLLYPGHVEEICPWTLWSGDDGVLVIVASRNFLAPLGSRG